MNNGRLFYPVRVVFVILLVIHVCFLADMLKNRDELPDIIRHALLEQGCAAENVDFVLENGNAMTGEAIYTSSEPIYYDGCTVNQWVVSLYSLSPGAPMHLSVRPYS